MPRAVMTRLIILIAAGALLPGLAGCGATSTTQAPSGPAASGTTVPGAEPLHISTYKVKGNERVRVATKRGDFTIQLYPAKAPNTVATFLELVSSGFYNGIMFHRVEPGFVVQAGDPLTKDPKVDPALYGTGGPGFRLKAEFNDLKHEVGTVAMARQQADPDSAGSQFYITLSPQPSLDGQYTIFGKVVSGMDTVNAIKKGDRITSMTIEPGP